MNDISRSLPSAQEVAEALEMPLEEAERLLDRMRIERQPKQASPKRANVIEWLVLVIVAGMLAAVVYPIRTRGCSSHRSSCLANAKMLSTAFQLYAMDYDDRLPPAGAWQDAIFDYHKNPSILTCPERKAPVLSYAYFRRLDARSLRAVRVPDRVPIVFESNLGTQNATGLGESFSTPHNRLGTVAFVDGHVERLATLPMPGADLLRPRR